MHLTKAPRYEIRGKTLRYDKRFVGLHPIKKLKILELMKASTDEAERRLRPNKGL